MGNVYADIELGNPRRPDLTAVRVRALADTGALMLCIPEHVTLQLSLEPESMREVSVADGRKMRVTLRRTAESDLRPAILLRG